MRIHGAECLREAATARDLAERLDLVTVVERLGVVGNSSWGTVGETPRRQCRGGSGRLTPEIEVASPEVADLAEQVQLMEVPGKSGEQLSTPRRLP